MGFDDGLISLDSENGAYYPGSTLRGRIAFDQGKVKTIHGIYVSFKGICNVHWTTQETRRVNDRTEHHTVNHNSYEEYVRRKVFIVGNSDGEIELRSGHHEFNFDFAIPSTCPSTFEGSHGHIRYRIKAVMVTSGIFSSNKEKKVAVRVVALKDLNREPYCKEPIHYQIHQSFCCWCFSSGSSEILVKLPVGGYCPGQVILIEVSCKNESNVEIDEIKFSIKKEVRFIAESSPGTRDEDATIATIKKGPIPGNTTRNWTIDMEVPAMDIYNLDGCRFIDVNYHFKVSTSVSGCHQDEDESHPIIFGNIPLVGYQDNVQNPLHDQMPKQLPIVSSYPTPVVNQPLPTSTYPNHNQSYPNSSPYPPMPNLSAVPPYPTVTPASPYPTNPNTSSPYPNQPYSNSNPGQPTNNSPYPHVNPGQPTNNSPYPAINAPYPVVNSASPAVNPPYPGGNSPSVYPSSPVAPYPRPSPSPIPPYPGSNPGVTSSPLLKTGTLGFTVSGDDSVTAPLLPPGATVPYPISPGNPYATASAPEPSTPDTDDKKPVTTESPEITANYPPYNPDFVNTPKKDNN